MKFVITVLICVAACSVCFGLGMLLDGEIRTIPPPTTTAAAKPSATHEDPPGVVYGPRKIIPQVAPPASMTDPDMEVCRSINTSCSGFWPQDRCQKSKTSWSAILTESQVNCVVAAQGLAHANDRADWIRGCGVEGCFAPQ